MQPPPQALSDFSLLPLKAGDHLWRSTVDGRPEHALYVGQFILAPPGCESEAKDASLVSPPGPVPQSVLMFSPVASRPGSCAVVRISLEEFVRGAMTMEGEATTEGRVAHSPSVRLYTRRPRGRLAAVNRGLSAVGSICDAAVLKALPALLPWWAIFDEKESFQPGLCQTRAFAKNYKLVARDKDAPVQLSLMSAILTGGAVVRQGRVVLRGARLMQALRLSRAATAGWANMGGFVGQALASNMLDDGEASTAVATAAGGWAGGMAGSGLAAAAASTMGVEVLGAGSLTGGLVLCSAAGAAGAVAGASLAYAAKKIVEPSSPGVDRTSEYYDCPLRLVGGADDVFDLCGAALEFPPEDASPAASKTAKPGAEEETVQRVAVAGWYAVRATSDDLQRLGS
mmetsp:Transcript_69918/g.130656  ORF Transcript_69918/g.130656 Transcript_69918/m.130656 type:complete len:399 (-) Transcript_69918:63-1259(-)